MTPSTSEPTIPGERLVTQFSMEQRGWLAAALIAFIGIVFVGPAISRARTSTRRLSKQAVKRVRRLGGGPMREVFRAGR